MHMIGEKDLSDEEMDTLTKSCSAAIIITANGEVQTHEEAIAYVKELDIFLTMKLLDDTPAVLSLGKLCDENGYSYEWINGQKPHLIEDGIPGSSSALKTPMKQESHSSSSSSSSSPTVGEIQVREKEDTTNSDISPVLLMIERGNLRKPKPTKTQNQKKKKGTPDRTGIPKSRNGCKNSGKFWWMMKSHYREALTPVLLMKFLESRLATFFSSATRVR